MSDNNIAEIRKQRGLSQTQLAEMVGTTLNMMGKLERGDRTLDTRWLQRIGEALNVEPHQLIFTPKKIVDEMVTSVSTSDLVTPEILDPKTGTPSFLSRVGKMARAVDHEQRDVVHIQKLDLSLSMGPGTLIDDWVEAEPVAFDHGFIQSLTRTPSDRLRLVTGIGDSMYPTLNWGDLILIDTTDRQLARQDGVYWIDVYGAAGLKRLRNIGKDRVLVISDNPGVSDMEVDAADIRIQGRAIWLARGI